MTRTGKIARLPRDLREQLNRRLADGEPGIHLVEWLNRFPQVKQTLAEGFNGREISEQNLSEWKQGGFRDWESRQETLAQARELAADAKEISEAADGSLADHLAMTLSARYAGLLSGWDGDANDEFRQKLRALRWLSQDVVELRRGDHSAARLKLEQDQLKEKQEWSEEELVSHFLRWAKNSKVREQICENCLSPEEKERRVREVFGLQVKVKSADAAEESAHGHANITEENIKDDVEVVPAKRPSRPCQKTESK